MTVVKTFLERKAKGNVSQYLAFLSACLANLTTGLHYGWSGPSLRKILSSEYPHEVTNEEAAYIVIVSNVGHVIGGFSGCALSDVIGRKYTLLGVTVPQLISMSLIYFSYHGPSFLYCARVIGGVAEGVVVSVLPMYVAEVASPEIRGIAGVLYSLAQMLGCLFINVLGTYVDIHTAAVICMAFPVIHWLCFVHFPETPYFLLMKGKQDKAEDSLKFLRASTDVNKEMVALTADVARQMSESGNYKDLFFIDSNRKAFFLVTAARIFQQFTGMSAFVSYYQVLIEQTTDMSPVVGSSLILITQIMMVLLSSTIVDRFGRKPLLTLSSGFTFLVLLILGIYFTLKDYTSLDLSGIQWFPVLMLVVFIITCYLGLAVIIPILISEMYSTSIKSKAVSLASLVLASTLMASTKFYQFSADNFGLAVPFYSFAVSTFIGTMFFHFKFPETKGKTLETIQQELKGNTKIPRVSSSSII